MILVVIEGGERIIPPSSPKASPHFDIMISFVIGSEIDRL